MNSALFSVCVSLLIGCGAESPAKSEENSGSSGTNANIGSNSVSIEDTLLSQTLTLNRVLISGQIGEEFQLSASGEGTGEIGFESSDTAVAEISNDGQLTLKSFGQAELTVTIASDSVYSSATALVPVNVSRKNTTIGFEIDDIALAVFETSSNQPIVSRNGAYYFHSSDTDVAMVDITGVVTAIGFGTAQITAKIPTNSEYESAATSYSVSVSRVNQEINFEPVPQPMQLFAGRTANAVAYALDGVPTHYRSLNESVVLVDDSGNITAVAEGSTAIQAYTKQTDQYNEASVDLPITVEDVLLTVTPSTNTLTFSWQAVSMFNHYRVYKRLSDIEGFDEVFHSTSAVEYSATVDPINDKSASFYFEACNDTYCYISDVTAVNTKGVFDRIIGVLKSDLPMVEDRFAQSMDISDDGTRLILGSPNENEQRGAVYLYELKNNQWVLHRKITNGGYPYTESGDRFGAGVAISGDGETIAFSAPGNDIDQNEYVERECKSLSCPYPDFPLVDEGSLHYSKWAASSRIGSVYNAYGPLGSQPKLNKDGSVLIYERKGEGNNESSYSTIYSRSLEYCCDDLSVTDAMKAIFDISADGKVIAIADNYGKYARVVVHKKGSYLGADYQSQFFQQLISDVPVSHVEISERGKRFIVITSAHQLLVFDLDTEIDIDDWMVEQWNYQLTYTSDITDYEVENATISDDGTRILIAGTDQIVRILVEDELDWIVQEEITSPNMDTDDCFGCVLAKPNNGDVFVIGAPGEDSANTSDLFDNSTSNNGSVYLF